MTTSEDDSTAATILGDFPAPRWAELTRADGDEWIHTYTSPASSGLVIDADGYEPEKIDVTIQVIDTIEVQPSRGVRVVRSAPQVIVGDMPFSPKQARDLRDALTDAISELAI